MEESMLTGILDEKGKFIYISPEDLEGIVGFVNKRGRISKFELAREVNRIVKLDKLSTIKV